MSLFSRKPTTDVIEAATDAVAAAPQGEHPFIEILRFTLVALIIVIPIRMFVAQPFIVSGASMGKHV
jgi:signal peptidase I